MRGKIFALQTVMHERQPWTPAEEALLGTDQDAVIAKRLGRTRPAVSARRCLLNISPFAISVPRRPCNWGAIELAMLGRYPDAEIARITGRSLKEVQAKRGELRS
jgi:hypothetical protein